MKCHFLPAASLCFQEGIKFKEQKCVSNMERWSVKNSKLTIATLMQTAFLLRLMEQTLKKLRAPPSLRHETRKHSV